MTEVIDQVQRFSLYDLVTGRVLSNGMCHPDMLSYQVREGRGLILEHVDWDLGYVLGDEVVMRPELDVADITVPVDGDPHVIASPPIGTTVIVDDQVVGETTEADINYAATVPGMVKVRLEPPFPHRPAEFVVTFQ